jgi:hypothetical protein
MEEWAGNACAARGLAPRWGSCPKAVSALRSATALHRVGGSDAGLAVRCGTGGFWGPDAGLAVSLQGPAVVPYVGQRRRNGQSMATLRDGSEFY